MDTKERFFSAISRKAVDKIPTTYRASEPLTKSLMKYFGIDDCQDIIGNYKLFLKKLGADMWSSGSKISKFSIFAPKYTGPEIGSDYVEDSQLFYTIGINSINSRIVNYDFTTTSFGINPPLAEIQESSDLKNGFLTKKLEYFDFNHMTNRYKDKRLTYEMLKDTEDIITIGSLSSIFMICIYLRGMEEFLTDMIANTKLAEKIINEVSDFCIEFSDRELKYFGGGKLNIMEHGMILLVKAGSYFHQNYLKNIFYHHIKK